MTVNKPDVAKSYNEETKVNEDLKAENIFSDSKDEKLTYRVEGIDGSGLTVDADGNLTGTTVTVDKDTDFVGTLYAKNESGDEKSATLTITVKDVAGEVTANVADVKKTYKEELPISEDLASQDFFTDSKGGKLTYSAEGIEGSGLSVNAAGMLTGNTVTVDKDTDFTGTLTATNEKGVSTSIPFTVTVENVPGEVTVNKPDVAKSYDETTKVNEDLKAENIFSDSKGETLTYRAEGIEGSGLSVDANGILSGTTASVDKDTEFTGTLYAKNESGDEKSATFKVTVKDKPNTVTFEASFPKRVYTKIEAVHSNSNPLQNIPNNINKSKDFDVTYEYVAASGSKLPPGSEHKGNGLLTSQGILPNDGVMGGMFDDKAYTYDVIAIVKDKSTGKELARQNFEVCVGQNRNHNINDLKNGTIACEKPPF